MKQNINTSSLTNFTLVDDTIQLKLNFNTGICLISMALNLNKLAAKIENRNLELIKYKAA